MKVRSNIDFAGNAEARNVPLPLLFGDIVNKEYADIPLNFSVRQYIQPDLTSINTSSNFQSVMTGFTVTTTSDTRVMQYQVILSLRLLTSVANKSIIIQMFINGSPQTEQKVFNLPTASTSSYEALFYVTIPANAVVSFQWSLGTVGGTVTAISTGGQLCSLKLIGIPNTLFTL